MFIDNIHFIDRLGFGCESGQNWVRGVGVSVGTTPSTVCDGRTRVGIGVFVGMTISVAVVAVVGDRGICVDTDVKVAGMVVGEAKVFIKVAVGVAVIVVLEDITAAWTGVENSICNKGAPAAPDSNDFATRLPVLPVMIIAREFPEFQLD